jgi:hypothetical protein
MRWKMMNQLNAMRQDMKGMFEATDDLMEDMDDLSIYGEREEIKNHCQKTRILNFESRKELYESRSR